MTKRKPAEEELSKLLGAWIDKQANRMVEHEMERQRHERLRGVLYILCLGMALEGMILTIWIILWVMGVR